MTLEGVDSMKVVGLNLDESMKVVSRAIEGKKVGEREREKKTERDVDRSLHYALSKRSLKVYLKFTKSSFFNRLSTSRDAPMGIKSIKPTSS